MSDLEKLETLFNEFGIKYEIDTQMRSYRKSNLLNAKNVIVVKLSTDYLDCMKTKVNGYSGFYSEYLFNPEDGSFIEVGIWE